MTQEEVLQDIMNKLLDEERDLEKRDALIRSFPNIATALRKAYEAGASQLEQTLKSEPAQRAKN